MGTGVKVHSLSAMWQGPCRAVGARQLTCVALGKAHSPPHVGPVRTCVVTASGRSTVLGRRSTAAEFARVVVVVNRLVGLGG
jgi:hypothetical protein